MKVKDLVAALVLGKFSILSKIQWSCFSTSPQFNFNSDVDLLKDCKEPILLEHKSQAHNEQVISMCMFEISMTNYLKKNCVHWRSKKKGLDILDGLSNQSDSNHEMAKRMSGTILTSAQDADPAQTDQPQHPQCALPAFAFTYHIWISNLLIVIHTPRILNFKYILRDVHSHDKW